MIIVFPMTNERMLPPAIRNRFMPQTHMPDGKEPTEQKQKRNKRFVRAQGVMYGGSMLVLSTHHDSLSETYRNRKTSGDDS